MKRLRNDMGFSLMELLIVMVILALIAALVGPRLFQNIGKSERKAAKTQISLFETGLDIYRLDVGKYPTTAQGLQALREKPDGVDRWDGPYLKKEVPLDPWGNPYVYEYPGKHGDYDILSLGADGRHGGEDENKDIASWKN